MKIKIKKSRQKSEETWFKNLFENQTENQIIPQKVHYSKVTGHASSTADISGNSSWSRHLFESAADKSRNLQDRMVITLNGEVVHDIELKQRIGLWVIGSDSLSDIQFQHPRVSKFHASLTCRDGRLCIEDLDSDHGTYLDGKRLKYPEIKELKDGSRVRIMGYQIDFYLHNLCGTEVNNVPDDSQAKRSVQSIPYPSNLLLTDLIENRDKIKTWRDGTTEFRVVEIITETHDVKTFRLAGMTPMVFSYQPGQFITLILSINGQGVRRSYSMSSSPSRPYTLDFTVKRVAGGLVSNWLCDQVQLGDCLRAKGPSGKFSCFHTSAEKVLLLAAGSGITPIMSMARWIADTGAEVDTKLLASFRYRQDIIFHREFELLSSGNSKIQTAITLSRGQKKKGGWRGYRGRINKKILEQFVPDLQSRTIFLCGPDAFMGAVKEVLEAMKFPMENLHHESFTSGHVDINVDYESLRKQVMKEKKYDINFVKSGITIPANDRFSFLELAEMNGIEMDYSCREGHCGECMVKCLAGKVTMDSTAEIDEKDRSNRWVYGCCAYPRSDILLDV